MTGIAGDKGLNFITTGHDKGVEPGMTALINGQLQYGYTAREFNHSHPQNTPILLVFQVLLVKLVMFNGRVKFVKYLVIM